MRPHRRWSDTWWRPWQWLLPPRVLALPRHALAPTLLARFGLVSLTLVILLGVILGAALHGSVERRALEGAIDEARVISLLGVQRSIVPDEVVTGLGPDRARAVRLQLEVSLAATDVLDVTIWDDAGRVLYSVDEDRIGHLEASDAAIARAASGEASAVVRPLDGLGDRTLDRRDDVVDVYVPLRFAQATATEPEGVVRATLPYGPIRTAIVGETRRLLAILVVALGVLYAGLVRFVADASRRLRRQAAENEHQARHDALTGLPNRSAFRDRLTQTLASTAASGVPLAVVLMDLDRFKEVNDTLGHHHGDLLLQRVASRLEGTLRTGDTIARLGGDEFALLLPTVRTASAALEVAAKVRAALERPVDVEGVRLEVGASLGIAMYPEHAADASSLLQRADVAMYAAKRDRVGQAVYDPGDDDHSRTRLTLSGELRTAIDSGQLLLHYQPKVDLRTRDVVGVEALVRWDHPRLGLLPPDRFVPLAERGDAIRPLTEAVLDQALAAVRRWSDAGRDLHVAVNLSVRNLHGDDLVAGVARRLTRHGVDPDRLTLEITETMIAADPQRSRRALDGLRALGVRLSIDDFGTGYSSLALLRELPVDELKIDRSFVTDLGGSADTAAIVGFSATLAHRLDLVVVAEGIEDESAAGVLRDLGCHVGQGYGISRPVAEADLLAWLDRRGSRRRVA